MATEDALRNRQLWDDRHSRWYGERGRQQWQADPHWGVWAVPETEIGILHDVAGKDLIDLGCGTAYIGAWASRAGARPVGLDNSAEQLATARELQQEFGIEFPLVHSSAEEIPLPDNSFDIAISEHGAIGWADPYLWIPEAARILRPGGKLIFVRNSTLLVLCVPDEGPAGQQLRRPQSTLHRLDDPSGGVNFHLPTSPMIRLLRQSGFIIDDIAELYVSPDAVSQWDYVDAQWASQWPSAEVWRATFSPTRA